MSCIRNICIDRHTDRQTGGRRNRQTDRQKVAETSKFPGDGSSQLLFSIAMLECLQENSVDSLVVDM